ncbi:MAG: transposase [Actinomycetota bacterium]|nr:transposase [Actinomycetota bacterium]
MQGTSCSAQRTSWARGLEFAGDDDRLVAHAGVLPVRLLAGRLGLTGGLSAAVRRPGFDPVYDRGQVLADLALTLTDGGEAISDFQALARLAPVIGPVPSNPAVWRTLAEAGDLQLTRVNTAATAFRRHWRGLLSARPEGFPWLKVAGRERTGITVVDLDAPVVFARSGKKENAVAAYKGGIGFCPDLAACDNTGDMPAIDPRPGNSWPSRKWAVNVAWTQAVLLAANILAAFRHLALPPGELRDAAPKLLRFRFLHVPGRLTRGQRKRWLHLRRDWPRAPGLIAARTKVKALPAPA